MGYSEPWKPLLVNAVSPPTLQARSLRATTGQPLSAKALAGGHLLSVEACTACHMVDGVGGRRGPDLSRVGDRRTSIQLFWRIDRGGGGMPAYGNVLKPGQVDDIVAYLESRVTPGQAAGSNGG
jgi:ubiquinol-cytochrome c reductase cytochrome b subunit